jgi:hypothetical protein
MFALLVVALLQAPQDLNGFLAEIEKDRAQGVATAELLKRVETWAKSKPPEIQARIAWNRELLKATIWINGLRKEWLGRRVGQSVTLGKTSGVMKEVRAESVVLESGEVAFHALGPEDGLAEIKAEKLVSAPTVEEAILLFAAGKTDAALAIARAFPSVLDRSRDLRAFIGWAIQAADRLIAEGKPVRAAEFLAAGWTKHQDLVEAADGALNEYVHAVLLARVYDEADKVIKKDRKEARRILDLVTALSKSREVADKVHALRFEMLDSNQWHPILLENVQLGVNAEFKDGKIGWADPAEGEPVASLEMGRLPFPWDHVSGVRAKIRHDAVYVDLRLGFDNPPQYFIVSVFPKDGKSIPGFQRKRGEKLESDPAKKVPTKAEYVLRFESGKPYWKVYVDSLEVKMFKAPGDPSEVFLVVNDGKCDLLSLELRRK